MNETLPESASDASAPRVKTTNANPTPLISRSHVKAFALACGQQRAWKPTRVSAEFYLRANACLSNFISAHVRTHPSAGTTIK
jgi:hypothetical protein